MKKLLVTAALATAMLTTAAPTTFANDLPYGISAKDMRQNGKLKTIKTALQEFDFDNVPGYYEWLHKKKNGVENGGWWRLNKLNTILDNSPSDMGIAVCTHLDIRQFKAGLNDNLSKSDKILDAMAKLECYDRLG